MTYRLGDLNMQRLEVSPSHSGFEQYKITHYQKFSHTHGAFFITNPDTFCILCFAFSAAQRERDDPHRQPQRTDNHNELSTEDNAASPQHATVHIEQETHNADNGCQHEVCQ